ncbi:MAG TPA: hypothetical protein VIK18_13675, partial [Pirellulales bacterium]
MHMPLLAKRFFVRLIPVVVVGYWLAAPRLALAETLVPGTGEQAAAVGDDFENPQWKFIFNSPKSSDDVDKETRSPLGFATNRRWFESGHRGQPDVLKRVATPEGGLAGSTGALLIRSLYTGVPNSPSGSTHQDDLVGNTKSGLGGVVPVSWKPSVVVRVFLPPWEQWEDRVGTSFALRANCKGSKPGKEGEIYWPGLFITRNAIDQYNKSSASLLVRGRESGHDYPVRKIETTGWWTLGLSFTPDGSVHYYGHPGVGDLTSEDHLASHYPYGFRCEVFQNYFFNVVSADNGRSWSTPWVIDDPTLYMANRPAAS